MLLLLLLPAVYADRPAFPIEWFREAAGAAEDKEEEDERASVDDACSCLASGSDVGTVGAQS